MDAKQKLLQLAQERMTDTALAEAFLRKEDAVCLYEQVKALNEELDKKNAQKQKLSQKLARLVQQLQAPDKDFGSSFVISSDDQAELNTNKDKLASSTKLPLSQRKKPR